jgi:LDH2 family malate/lactate/ureidoglycolate dehydrogenase
MAAPTGRHGTIALDMATSVVAAGRIVQARAKGERIPSDWALTEDGEPTTDATKAVISLPLGGPKGAGLALMIELLTGALGGAPIMTKTLDLHGTRKAHQNALIVLVDIAALRPEADYRKDADELGTLIKQLPRRPGIDEILLPGDRGRRTDAKRRRDGIPIPAATWKALEAVASACGVALPEPLPAK